jgi:GNAT superfamily N-acetyltransferase
MNTLSQSTIGQTGHGVYVAEADGALIGWVHVFVNYSLLADTPAEVAGLVVDENYRSRGVGRILMEKAGSALGSHSHQRNVKRAGSVTLQNSREIANRGPVWRLHSIWRILTFGSQGLRKGER